jgi:PAS domain S-box-containing protein
MACHEAMNRIRQSDKAPLYIGGLEVSRPETAEAFFQQQTDAICLFDASGTIIHFNEQLPDMLGYSAETLYEHFAVFNPPDQIEAVTAFFTRALSGETVHYMAQGLHADQHRVTLKITNMPVEQDGQVIGVYGVARDITRETHLEGDVTSIRSQLELSEQIPELIVFHFDVRKQTIEFSPALLHFLGLSEVDATTLDQAQLFSRIHPLDFDRLQLEMECLIANEKDRLEMEVSLLTADDTYQLLRLKAFHRPHHPNHLSVVLYGLSEVDEARRQLVTERALAREIYEAVNAAISQIDLISGRILFHSQGFLHIFEELPQDLILSHEWLLERLEVRDHAAMKQFIGRLVDGQAGTIQYRLHFPDGRIKWIEDQQIPVFQLDGTIAYTNSIMHDITLQKVYEEQLRQLALRGAVTRLPNRQALIETIDA